MSNHLMDPNSIQRPRTSASAIASLVCSLFGCIPIVTGLAAVILGIVGIRKTRDPMLTGRGIAITGLILGSLSLAGWTLAMIFFRGGIIGGIYAIYKEAEPARATALQFTKNLSEGKIDEALAFSVEGMDRAALVALSERMKPWGTAEKLDLSSVNIQATNAKTSFTIGGSATFSNEIKTYTMTLIKVGESYKVEKVDFP